MKRMKAEPSHAWVESTAARKSFGISRENIATIAPNRPRMRTHRSIEPSWLPQTPEIL